MRIERKSGPASIARARAAARSRPAPPSLGWYPVAAFGLMAALVFLASLDARAADNARAADKVTVEAGGKAAATEDTGGGMPSSNPRVRPILAAHPGQLVVICVAGCDGKPRAVQVLPGPVTGRVGAFVPSAGKMGKEVYGPPRPARLAGKGAAESEVICVAGCTGRPGQVLQRLSDLPPPKRPAAKGGKDDGSWPLDTGP